MLLGDDLDNFHNFFHQLLELWIIHVVLSLMSRLVHTHLLVDNVVIRFDIQLDSFRVSTSSAIAIRMLPVFRSSYSSSNIAHRPSNTSIVAPLCSFQLQTTNSSIRSEFSKLAIDQPSTCFQILPTQSQTHSTRLPGSFVR